MNVYLHKNKKTGKVFYVGHGSSRRPYDLRTTGVVRRSDRWIELSGGDVEVIIVEDNIPTRKQAMELEDLLIEMLREDTELANVGTNTEVQRMNGGVMTDKKHDWYKSEEFKSQIKQAKSCAPTTNGINALKKYRESLSPEQRSERARNAAIKRWSQV